MKRARPLGSFGAALVAVLALLVQWTAAPAMAFETGPTVEICTGEGVKLVHLPSEDGAGHDHAACDHCCVPGAVASPEPTARADKIAGFKNIKITRPKPRQVSGDSRAPPRPPGQAPPQS